jgi:hypothetical protein
VTKNGDIKKCILVEGLKEGGRPVQGDVVLVKSQGKLKDGTMIDDYPTLVFRVGEYEVIEGLDLVVQVRMRLQKRQTDVMLRNCIKVQLLPGIT